MVMKNLLEKKDERKNRWRSSRAWSGCVFGFLSFKGSRAGDAADGSFPLGPAASELKGLRPGTCRLVKK
jgi:hypothetical protein